MALIAAFVVAPRTLAARTSGSGFDDEQDLAASFRRAFAGYWSSGDREFSPGLERVVDHWFHYHVAKAVIATVLLVVLVALGILLWRAFLGTTGDKTGRQAGLASAGVLVTVLALLSLAAVVANIQGAKAPFASLLPMLGTVTGTGTNTGEGILADTLDQVRQRLADSLSTDGPPPPVLDVMISDFARYHVAMVVLSGIVAVVFVGISVASLKKRAATGQSDRRTRRVLGSFGVLSAVLTLVVTVVLVANMTTAADPAPPLLALFEGGW
ncbi:hypothetical protein OHA98_22785 [Streptomyces sp. NBC_00654]|uniref:hypothetical protein n=1 Tax=Streptomyces sp. NBC_00654 TaxID=2975799 RepID=UPI0022542F99|nr:hypothetical protein [Streptomyces sp. NBC_00654]MCX4967533.1 hypothetical protein [Streptomyces sp. NBC_00654]